MADVNVKNINEQPIASASYYVGVDAAGKAIRVVPSTGAVEEVVGLTGVITQAELRTALGLGSAAYLATGTTGSTVALGNHTHSPSSLGAEPAITAGTTSQYYRGDKTWVAFPSIQVPVQYQNAGSNISTAGAVTSINFTGNAVVATASGNDITVTINASGGAGGTVTSVGATAPAAGFTTSVANATSTPVITFTLADDLAAVEGISTTGFVKRTASNTWSTVSGITLTSDVSGILPVANGGTGTATPGLVQGTNVTITGTWPNQTINASGGGGGGDMTKLVYDPNDDGKIAVAQTSGFGTSATLNVAASGNAGTGEVVKGDDTRLSDARSPTAHNQAASTISDSTATGRALLTATDAAAARTTLGLGSAAQSATGDFAPASLTATVEGHTTTLGLKQDTLVSGTNIKTVNGQSLLGSGDISISGGGSAVTLSGATSVETNLVTAYTITNYSTFSTYSVTVSAGSVSITGDQISFTAPAAAQAVTLNVTVDGVVSAFNITVTPSSYIQTPTPTPTNFGDPFEGGFYAGLYWDQIAQSSSSKTLATGAQAFTVPDMIGNGITYIGQSLEVRSRANPANKFIGTVTSAAGTTLTLNVSSIGGSGTFSDWSVMARFRAIVAPKSSGETALAIKNANTALPAGCQSLVDGLTATNAMKNADTSTVYPAAHWARGLSIGGKTDWHIPARDVLELAWRNLKPGTDSNYTTTNRSTSASFNYKIDGAYGDVSPSHGVNNHTSPVGVAYTSGVPAQTAAVAFRTGGAEAFIYTAYSYLSSTEYTAAENWVQHWNASYPGYQTTSGKNVARDVRAFRRSII